MQAAEHRDEFDYRFDVLMREVEDLQSNIRNYDTVLFTIKGWAITLFSGIAYLCVKDDDERLVALATLTAILFWSVDALFKSYQRGYIVRHNRIEHFLRSKEFSRAISTRSFNEFIVPDINGHVSVKNWEALTNPLISAKFPTTALLYEAMLIATVALAILLAI